MCIRDRSGLVSQTDVVLARKGRSLKEMSGLHAGDIMTRDMVTCTPDTPIAEAIAMMTRHHIHRLVVVDTSRGNPWPIGVVSMTDVITYGMGNGPLGDLTMSLPPSGIADLYEPLMPEPGLIDLVEDATLVRDVMHGGVIVCNTATPLLDVAKTMLANNIHAVVVVTEDEMATGVVSQLSLIHI